MRLERILMAGTGGQGVILAGRLLAEAALRHFAHVTFFPSYGAEVRGGLSSCQTVLSSEEIASPVCDSFDTLVLMRCPDVHRYLPLRAPHGLVLMDLPTSVSEQGIITLDATGLADGLGDARVANFVLVGRLLAVKPLFPRADMEAAIRRFFHSKSEALAELNVRALRCGQEVG